MQPTNAPAKNRDSFVVEHANPSLADVIDDWRSIFNAEAAILTERRIGRDSVVALASAGIDQRFVAQYQERWSRNDPWSVKLGSTEGAWLTEDLCSHDRLIATDFYKSWLVPQELDQGVRAVINLDDERCWIVTILFHAQLPLPKRFLLGALGVAFPLLKAAARMLNSMEDRTLQRDVAIGVLDHLAVGVILIDGRGRPVVMNRSAGELIAKSGSLFVGRHGVYASKPIDNQRLQQMIERLAANGTSNEPMPEAVPISRGGNAVPMSVIGTSLKRHGLPKPEDLSVALFVSDPEDGSADASEERLIALYALTRLEARLAARLASGRSLEEIAADLRVSIHTVRAYLKQIFAKTNVHRQSDLVRILVNGTAHVRTLGVGLGLMAATEAAQILQSASLQIVNLLG